MVPSVSRLTLCGLVLAALVPAPAQSPLRISWSEGPEYPMGIQDSALGVLHGKVISAGGFTRHPKDILHTWPDIFAGAKSGFTNAVFVFDPRHAAAGWTRIADVLGPARQAAAAAVAGDALYVVGGFSYSAPHSYRSTYRLHEEGGRWIWSKLDAELPWPLCEAGVAVIGSKIYLTGGADFYAPAGVKDAEFNSERGRAGDPVGRALLVLDTANPRAGWQRLADLPGTPRFDSAVAAAVRKVYALSGVYRGDPRRSKGYCNVIDSWVYDPPTARWSRLPDLPHDSNQRAIPYGDRYLVLVGGYRYGVTRNPDGTETSIYSPTEKQADWKQFFERTVQVYDTRTNRLAAADPLPDKTSLPMGAIAGDTIFVLGGEGGTHLWHPATFFVGRIVESRSAAGPG